jgi:hypothetical protein
MMVRQWKGKIKEKREEMKTGGSGPSANKNPLIIENQTAMKRRG